MSSIDSALRNTVTVEAFLRDFLRMPDGFHISVVDGSHVCMREPGFSVMLVDGVGHGARYWREEFAIPPVAPIDPAAFLRCLIVRTEGAMLAMCEFPERFSDHL